MQIGPEILIEKSTTGFYTFVDGNLVTWKNKKQNVIAQSNAEAEYRTTASTASELTWIKQLFLDVGINTQEPMKIFCDNQTAQHIALNPVFHERTKHIEVDYHFIREKIRAKEIKLSLWEVKTNWQIFSQRNLIQNHLKWMLTS